MTNYYNQNIMRMKYILIALSFDSFSIRLTYFAMNIICLISKKEQENYYSINLSLEKL